MIVWLLNRKTSLKEDEVIVSINVPYSKQNEYVFAYKQARRREDDIAIVSSCFRVLLSSDNSTVEVTALIIDPMRGYQLLTMNYNSERLVQLWWDGSPY